MSEKQRTLDIVRAGYDEMGEKYHRHRESKFEKVSKWLKLEQEFFPDSGHVLDIGCGGGVPVAKYFAENDYSVTGIDLSPKMISLARKSVPSGRFICTDMQNLPFGSEEFEIIVSLFAIIHVPRELHNEILGRVFSILKPNGIFLVTLGFEDIESRIVDDWMGARMFWSHYDIQTYEKMLKEVGFEILLSEKTGREKDFHSLFRLKKTRTTPAAAQPGIRTHHH